MHEFSLAQGLHRQLLDLVKQHQADKVTRAEILIGSNAGIVEESFMFGVDILSRQHLLWHLALGLAAFGAVRFFLL